MVFSRSSTFASSSSQAVIAVVLALAVAQSALAQQSVYVPGNADEVPGVAVNEVGVGADGMTTYDVGGVTLAENSAAAVLTQNLPQGQVIYNCQLGPDAIATCEVQQVYDGASYTYQEPITFFGQTTAQLPAAFQTTATPATATAAATTAPRRITTSGLTIPTSAESATRGPQANAAQVTSSNVFGGAQDTGSASSRAAVTTAAGALIAVMAGVVAFL